MVSKTNLETCCKTKGVPDACLGYCELETKKAASRSMHTGICKKYEKYIKECQKGTILGFKPLGNAIYYDG